MQSSLFGLHFILVLTLTSCVSDKKSPYEGVKFIPLVDSISFMDGTFDAYKYESQRFGKSIFRDSNGQFIVSSIDVKNRFHTFNVQSNTHTYSKPVTIGKLDAYYADSANIYFLSNNVFYIKDHHLNTLDSFNYKSPSISQDHGIDYSSGVSSNVFKVNNYFAVMYYVVDIEPNNMLLYRNSDPLFYYFNKDTAFFANKGCPGLDTSFQYFRYPAAISDGKYLFHAPRVMNYISKSDEIKTHVNTKINQTENNYLEFNHEDQYQISKLKKYRFTSDYNRDIILANNKIYLLKEFLHSTSVKNDAIDYDRRLEIKVFDKSLNLIETLFIKNDNYTNIYIEENRLYLYNFSQNYYLIYEI